MATYAIGDIQGCYDPLRQLLDKIKFDPGADRLWFAGDLVNRGPQSLETLQLVKSLGDTCICVLGNHDIHLLALHYGVRKRKTKDKTLFQVLDSEEQEELIRWLQSRPLVHMENGYVLVHAGVHPQWTMETLQAVKAALEDAIKGVRQKEDLSVLYGNSKGSWHEAVETKHKLRYALNCLTRMRYCHADTSLDFQCSDSPGKQPLQLIPWFEIDNDHMAEQTILFGHWAALGYHHHNNVYALDSGCVWGNALTALRLEDKAVFSVTCKG